MVSITISLTSPLPFFLYSTCSTVQNTQPERAYFFNTIAETFANLVQYSEEEQILSDCQQILSFDGTSMEKLAQYLRLKVGDCIGLYNDFLELYANISLTTNICKTLIGLCCTRKNFHSILDRQWYYQSCTEFGWFETSNSDSQPFQKTIPIDLFIRYCLDLFDGL